MSVSKRAPPFRTSHRNSRSAWRFACSTIAMVWATGVCCGKRWRLLRARGGGWARVVRLLEGAWLSGGWCGSAKRKFGIHPKISIGHVGACCISLCKPIGTHTHQLRRRNLQCFGALSRFCICNKEHSLDPEPHANLNRSVSEIAFVWDCSALLPSRTISILPYDRISCRDVLFDVLSAQVEGPKTEV